MNEQNLPPGWDAERVERLLAHYDTVSDEEQVAEDEEAGNVHSPRVDAPSISSSSNEANDRD